jgi:plasmid stability protein
MAQLLIRGLEPEDIERLRTRAKRHQRSLEAEARVILKSAEPDPRARAEAIRFAREMRCELAGKIHGDSADMIRADRDR